MTKKNTFAARLNFPRFSKKHFINEETFCDQNRHFETDLRE